MLQSHAGRNGSGRIEDFSGLIETDHAIEDRHSVVKPVTRIGWMSVLFTTLLMYASMVSAQTTIDPRTAEFVPSADHSRTGPDGTPLVQTYLIEFYLQGAAQPFQSASLGKPAPDPDGQMSTSAVALWTPGQATSVSGNHETGRNERLPMCPE